MLNDSSYLLLVNTMQAKQWDSIPTFRKECSLLLVHFHVLCSAFFSCWWKKQSYCESLNEVVQKTRNYHGHLGSHWPGTHCLSLPTWKELNSLSTDKYATRRSFLCLCPKQLQLQLTSDCRVRGPSRAVPEPSPTE